MADPARSQAGETREPATRSDLRCTCFRVRRAARRLTQAYDAALSGCDVSPVQLAVLAELMRAEPISVAALADRLGTDRTTLSRTVARMESAGWIVDGPAGDARARGLRITEAGGEALGEATRAWRRAETAMARRLGADRLSLLYDLLIEAESAAADIEAANAPLT